MNRRQLIVRVLPLLPATLVGACGTPAETRSEADAEALVALESKVRDQNRQIENLERRVEAALKSDDAGTKDETLKRVLELLRCACP